MYLTGFADEAATGIDGQIRATRDLGWRYIEARNIDGKNIHDISDEQFDEVCAKLADAGVGINCFGSTIANWGKTITDATDTSIEETRRAIPRMQRLGTKLVRVMSYAWCKDRDPEDQMAEERFRRLRELQAMFADAGIQPVHENCMNYGGLGYTYTLRLLENVPGLKLVFDTGNPTGSDDYTKAKPYPKQSAWEFYSNVKEFVEYIHIKDAVWDAETGTQTFTHAGEGQGDVKRIVKAALDNGYNGGISMEPHLAVVFHDDSVTASEDVKYANYIEYGRRFMTLIEEIGHADKLA